MNLSGLRINTVRRMWSITNQLNILYESNWTQLVLAELIEFEGRLFESLAAESSQSSDSGSLELSSDSESERAKAKDKDKARDRSRSMKKSLIHSLATITTIGEFQNWNLLCEYCTIVEQNVSIDDVCVSK